MGNPQCSVYRQTCRFAAQAQCSLPRRRQCPRFWRGFLASRLLCDARRGLCRLRRAIFWREKSFSCRKSRHASRVSYLHLTTGSAPKSAPNHRQQWRAKVRHSPLLGSFATILPHRSLILRSSTRPELGQGRDREGAGFPARRLPPLTVFFIRKQPRSTSNNPAASKPPPKGS